LAFNLQTILLLSILLFAFALRLYRLGAGSLWYDETVSVYLAGQSLPELVAHTAADIHPPGYYLLLHAWTRLAGAGDFAVAFFSLFFGVLLVALVYRLGARLFGPRTALLAAGLVALSPYNVWYSQEVRMYTLGAALGLGLLDVTLSWLQVQGRGGRQTTRYLAGYALFGALGLWTLYYFAFLLAAVNLMVVAWWLQAYFNLFGKLTAWRESAPRRGLAPEKTKATRGRLGRWGLAQGAVLLLYAPWLPIAWRQATDPPVPPWRSFTPLGQAVVETWTALSLGQSVEPTRVWPILLVTAALFVTGLLAGRRRARPAAPWFLAGYLLLPLALIYLASLLTPLYHVRYAFTYAPPFYLLLAAGLGALFNPARRAAGLWWRRWRPLARGLAWLALALLVLFSTTSIYAYHTDPRYAADDHRAAVQFLAEAWRPGDAILVNAGYTYTALVVYWDGPSLAWRGRLVDYGGQEPLSGPIVAQTGTVDGDPSLGWGRPEADFYAMGRDETAAALERLFARAHRVWHYRIYDTVTDPDGYVRDWLDEQATLFEDEVFTGESQLRVQGYVGHRDPLAWADLAAVLDGEALRLPEPPTEGVTTLPVGGDLDLALAWQVAAPPQGEVILFAGLFDEAGRRWAQVDERPLGSLYRARAWPPGRTVRTPLRLRVPAGTPPGRYRLLVGWYRFVEGRPAWLPWPDGALLPLGEVAVVAPADWRALPRPAPDYAFDLDAGPGLRFLGFDAPALSAPPGGDLALDLYWLAVADAPEAGPALLQVRDEAGRVWIEAAGPPAGGLAPFPGLAVGQVVRDPRTVSLPADLPPGVYDLALGRRGLDGTWLRMGRGPISLGDTYPLATIWVRGREGAGE
jgi:hypothetical protein